MGPNDADRAHEAVGSGAGRSVGAAPGPRGGGAGLKLEPMGGTLGLYPLGVRQGSAPWAHQGHGGQRPHGNGKA